MPTRRDSSGAFLFDIKDHEYTSEEFMFIALSMLESRGYYNLIELMSVIDDPKIFMKVLYLMGGMEIKLPTAGELGKTLQASTYAYCDMTKNINTQLVAKPKDIRATLDITEKEEKELLEIFDTWAEFMWKQGYKIEEFIRINRRNTKLRIKNIRSGRKWTAKKY